MGKASSAKKVARAARAGGRASGVKERHLLFPGIIGAIVVLGVALVWVARSDYSSSGYDIEPQIGTHWHAAYGVYVCDREEPVAENFDTPRGIHSHGDSAIHVHPFSRNASGENATLGVFIDESPLLDLSDTELTVGDETWDEDEDTCIVDGEEVPGEVVVAKWENGTDDGDPTIYRTGLTSLRFENDGEAYMIAFVPRDEVDDIPKPESVAMLANLTPDLTQDEFDNISPENRDRMDLDEGSVVPPAAGPADDAPDDAEDEEPEEPEEPPVEGPVLDSDDSGG